MTVRKVWLGSTGPFLYDDAVPYIDPDGTVYPDNQNAIATDGNILLLSPPESDFHAVRRIDMEAVTGNISALTARVDALEGRMNAAESNIGNLQSRMGNAEANITNLLSRMSSAESSIGSLHNLFNDFTSNFSLVPITIQYYGLGPTPVSLPAVYTRTSYIVSLYLPGYDGVGVAGSASIDVYGFPVDFITYRASGIDRSVLVFTEQYGWDWCNVGFMEYGLRILPYIKTSSFPQSGRKYLLGGVITWILAGTI